MGRGKLRYQARFICSCTKRCGNGVADSDRSVDIMRKGKPLPIPELDEPNTPTGLSASPFSEAMEDPVDPANSSAPELVNHPHLENSMRSLSSSVASRRKEYIQKRTEAESQNNKNSSSLSRAERIAFMKRTRSVSTSIHTHLYCQFQARI